MKKGNVDEMKDPTPRKTLIWGKITTHFTQGIEPEDDPTEIYEAFSEEGFKIKSVYNIKNRIGAEAGTKETQQR